MLVYLLKRVIAALPVMLVVVTLVFLLLHLSPGDPANIIAGEMATPQEVERIRIALGLDQPLHQQFMRWMGQVVTGDLGTSIYSGKAVRQLIAERLEPTLALSFGTIVLTIIIAVPLGIVSAWRAGTTIDTFIMIAAVAAFSVPIFVIGYALVYIFSMRLGWLPVQGYSPFATGTWPFIRSLILPCFALAGIYIALVARITRASMLEVLNQDYIRTARSKGLPERRVLMVHALKNAAIPIVTVLGLGIAMLIGGVVVVESVFAIPGLGRLAIDAILQRDYPVIQGLILFFSFIYVVINLIIDVSYVFFDPRIRY